MVRGMGWDTGLYGIRRDKERKELEGKIIVAIKFKDGAKACMFIEPGTDVEAEIKKAFNWDDVLIYSNAPYNEVNAKKAANWWLS